VRAKLGGGKAADDFIARNATAVPLGHVGQPEEIAVAAAFLAGERASFINGADIQIDGGRISMVRTGAKVSRPGAKHEQ